ncbi:hypothetical protein AAHE18_12G024900 [Arachis hypogaea]
MIYITLVYGILLRLQLRVGCNALHDNLDTGTLDAKLTEELHHCSLAIACSSCASCKMVVIL